MKQHLIFTLIGVALVALVGWGIWANEQGKPDPNAPRTVAIDPSAAARAESTGWRKGAQNPTVALVAYEDFQCPACASAAPVLRSLVDVYGAQGLAFEFRHFPLTQHSKAVQAAVAAEAAGRQGKFWEFHDRLYSSQESWTTEGKSAFTDRLKTYATELGLDVAQWERDTADKALAELVSDSAANGRRDNVTGTPFLMLDGKEVTFSTYVELEQKLTTALREKAGL